MSAPNYCPVCRSRFPEARFCSCCGADLQPLMLLAGKAWQLRQTARRLLQAGDFDAAYELASSAQKLQSTASGESLLLLAAWLKGLDLLSLSDGSQGRPG